MRVVLGNLSLLRPTGRSQGTSVMAETAMGPIRTSIIIVIAAVLLTSCVPLLVGGVVGGAIVAHHYHGRGWCQAPNGVVFRCHHYLVRHRR